MRYKYIFLLSFFLIGCVNNNKDQRLESNIHINALQKSADTINIWDTVKALNNTGQLKNDSKPLKEYDLYQFENDTVLQSVYIRYLTPRKIHFIIKSKNKRSLNECEYSDTAGMADGEGTAQGSDELNEDELYNVYEYFTKKHVFFTIDVEFKRGKRMTVFTKSDTMSSNVDCPLSSKGTLRRRILSQEIQNNPTW